jgi:hypothetical protein
MADKVIKAIRYSGSNWENVAGNSMPSTFGLKIFEPGDDMFAIGERIARKLNEFEFHSGEFDHLDINFTTVFSPGEFAVSGRQTEKWLKYVDFGLDPGSFNAKTKEERDSFIMEATFQVLNRMYLGNESNLKIIAKVKDLTRLYGRKLVIGYKIKETKSYKIEIGYQIKPYGPKSIALLNYHDKKTGFKGMATYDLDFYDNIYTLIDSISVKDKTIICTPKKSFRAEVYNESYPVPLQFEISSLNPIVK